MPNNELQPCPKYVYTFRTRFDKDIAQKKEKPQNIGTKYGRFVDIRKSGAYRDVQALDLQYWQVRTARLLYQVVQTNAPLSPRQATNKLYSN
jgi:hypothetical protein